MELRIHKILTGSCANGPGIRNTVWFQGCTLNCPGCFNPQTHDPIGGYSISTDALCKLLLPPDQTYDGITISGGEPFQQPEALCELLHKLKSRKRIPIIVFSGYSFDYLQKTSPCAESLPLIDALICGPYVRELPPDYQKFCSSGNQELILLSDSYTKDDFENLPLREYFLDDQGNTIISGIFS